MGLQVIVKHNSFKFLCIRGVCFYIPNFLFFLSLSLFKTILKKCLFILLVFSNNQCLDLVIISVLFIYLANTEHLFCVKNCFKHLTNINSFNSL